MRAIITGGPGSGCTSTASFISKKFDIPHFDTDSYFHKPSDPPYQQQFSAEERRNLITTDLRKQESWILSGSVATWDLPDPRFTHGIILDPGTPVRLKRLVLREQANFGKRILPEGDMHQTHLKFMEWAEGYELRKATGRNLVTDTGFIIRSCLQHIAIPENPSFEETCLTIGSFLEKQG
ncbi:MAG: hypothetical protein ACSHX7_11580 [Luteolibacter sp.]